LPPTRNALAALAHFDLPALGEVEEKCGIDAICVGGGEAAVMAVEVV
jgi:hypothetical protein